MSHEHYDDASLLAFLEGSAEAVDLSAMTEGLAGCRECAAHLKDVEKFDALLRSFEWIPEGAEDCDVTGMVELSRKMEAEDQVARTIVGALPSGDIHAWPTLLAEAEPTGGLARALLHAARSCHKRTPADSPIILDVIEHVLRRVSPRLVSLEGDLWKERANAFRHLGHYQDALRALQLAERCYGELPIPAYDMAFVRWGRGSVYYLLKRFADATRELEQAKVTLREFGDDLRLAQVQLVEGGILFDYGRTADARRVFGEAAHVFEQYGDEENLARAYANLCTCDARLGELVSALRYGQEAARRFDEQGMDAEAVRLFWSVGEALIELGRPDEALGYVREAAERFERLNMVGEAMTAHLDTLAILLERGDAAEAAAIASRAAAFFVREGANVDAALAMDRLKQAAAALRATPKLVRYIQGYIAAHLRGEDARFEPPQSDRPS